MRYHLGMSTHTSNDLHEERLYQTALHFYYTEGRWPTVRALRTALKTSQKSAMDALRRAKRRVSIDEAIEESGVFAALCIYAELEKGEAIDILQDLSRREISPQNGNTHLSRKELRMILALQRPHIDSSTMTKKQLLDSIINPAFLRGRSLVSRAFNDIEGDCAKIKDIEAGNTEQTDKGTQHRQNTT